MAKITLPDVLAEKHPLARVGLACGFLESTIKALDGVDDIPSIGKRIQSQEHVLGLELLKQVNFAIGVRNKPHHQNEMPNDEELASAAKYLLKAVNCHLPLLGEDDKKRLLGTAYQPPPEKPRIHTLKRKAKSKKPKAKPKKPDLKSRVPALLNALATGGQIIRPINSLADLGFNVSALRNYVPEPTEQQIFAKVRSLVASASSTTGALDRFPKVNECQQHFDLSKPAHCELRTIVDAFLLEHGRHPRTGQHVKKVDRRKVLKSITSPAQPEIQKPWWKFW